ncbi:hypothetical protein C3K47_15700 [Solitalea longa]|uniref:Uncharacterized protein n=1 Tax=Solitalea longa TaxID=2079460 RepID=A0A2S4ZZV3_9SPHI|nr:hypothetical protein [Solitalea longa]POY35502.1 hypothetical protein C3K47_15700 [Solitalea longa]
MSNDLNLPIVFNERLVVNTAISKAHPYDLVTDDFLGIKQIENIQYCSVLIKKFENWKLEECQEFVKHQIKGLTDPISWLHSLRMLLAGRVDKDKDRFITLGWLMKHALVVDELKDAELRLFKKYRKFDFDEVSKELCKLDSYPEKLKYLIKCKTEYLQFRHEEPKPIKPEFDAQIDLEIEKINQVAELDEKYGQPKSTLVIKARWLGNVNVLGDLFFQLTSLRQTNGKSYLDLTVQQTAELISQTFLDKDGREISVETMKTILNPSRIDKRPKENKQIDIESLIRS